MERAKLVVPVRRLENSACKLSNAYDPDKVEKIKTREDVNRFSHVKELASIESDLKDLVRRIKVRRYIGLVYQISVLKVHLGRLLARMRRSRRAARLSCHMVQRHSHRSADLSLVLAQNQNSPSKSANQLSLGPHSVVPRGQYFRGGGVFG